MTDPSGLEGVERQLSLVVRLLSALLVKGMNRKDAILTLSGAGLAPREVAAQLGISANQVSVAIYDERKAAKKQSIPSRT
jgi:hypothetical protein